MRQVQRPKARVNDSMIHLHETNLLSSIQGRCPIAVERHQSANRATILMFTRLEDIVTTHSTKSWKLSGHHHSRGTTR